MMTSSLNLDSFQRFLNQFSALNLMVDKSPKIIQVAESTSHSLNYSGYSDFLREFSSLYQAHLASGNLINLFTLLGPKRNELKNVALLAWAFDCSSPHGQGAKFFHSFLDILSNRYSHAEALQKHNWQSYSVQTELNPFGDHANRVDMILKSKDVVIYIEVKIDAGEGDDQISRYLEKLKQENARHKALIFLTARQDFNKETVVLADWNDIAASLNPLPLMAEFPKNFFQQLAKHFASLMRKNTSKKHS